MMNNWQEWLVGVIVVFCVGYVFYKIYLTMRKAKKNIHPCEGCLSDCKLKDIARNKASSKPQNRECSNKKCC